MKKIIYSLLLCFILLFTIPSVRADGEIVYKDGKELYVTTTKATAFEGIDEINVPDGKGYFIESSANWYKYITEDKEYDILKTNKYLPLDLYDTSCNLDPTMFGDVYVYNGYWAYDKNNKPLIKGSGLVSSNESNLFVHPSEFNSLLLEAYINNTFGFFILDPFNDSKVIYRFYNTYKYNDSYLIDTNNSYLISFDKNYSFLPNNYNATASAEYYDADTLSFYSTINGKWKNYSFIKDVTYSFNNLIVGECFIDYSNYSQFNLYPVVTYFNLVDINKSLMNIDYISKVSINMSYYMDHSLIPLESELEYYSETFYPVSDTFDSNWEWYKKLMYKRQFDRITDAENENLDYFEHDNKLYRFKISTNLFLNLNFKINDIDFTEIEYMYNGVFYTDYNPKDDIKISNSPNWWGDFNLLDLFKIFDLSSNFNVLHILGISSVILLSFFSLKMYFKYKKNNKK